MNRRNNLEKIKEYVPYASLMLQVIMLCVQVYIVYYRKQNGTLSISEKMEDIGEGNACNPTQLGLIIRFMQLIIQYLENLIKIFNKILIQRYLFIT